MNKRESVFFTVFSFLLIFPSCNSKVKEINVVDSPKDTIRVSNVKDGSNQGRGISHRDTIIIKNMQFNPSDLHIKKGTDVVWINNDIVTHDATEYPDKTWTSGPLPPGKSWSMKVDQSFDYFCSIHITMKGRVTVGP